MKQPISHSRWVPASTGHLDEPGMKHGGAHGEWGPRIKHTGLALPGVKWKLAVESFVCLLDDSKHLSGHSQADCHKTNLSAHLSLDSHFAWALEG